MRAVSLFSGCLGLDLGLESAGVETVCYVENEPACQTLIRERRPGVEIISDVRTLDADAARRLGRVDAVAGGFPCQDLSYAGRGAGLEGERSGLWFEMLRVVELLEPESVLIENVPALMSRGLGVVLHGLARAGYSGYWFTLAAAHVGAPHLRLRAFVLATNTGREFGGGHPAGRFDDAGWMPTQESLFDSEPIAKFGKRGRWTESEIFEDPDVVLEPGEVLLPTPNAYESTPTPEYVAESVAAGIDPGERLYLPGRKWHAQRTLSRIVPALLPTPTGDDANNVTRSSGTFSSLAREAHLLPTPNTSDRHGSQRTAAEEGWTRPSGTPASKGMRDVALLLPTPVANPENPGAGGELPRRAGHRFVRPAERGQTVEAAADAGRH